jgi:hypothetical protein
LKQKIVKKYDSGGIRTHALNGLEPKPSALDLSATLPLTTRTGSRRNHTSQRTNENMQANPSTLHSSIDGESRHRRALAKDE